MRVIIQKDPFHTCLWAARYIAGRINGHENGPQRDRPFILGLPTGSSPLGVYKELIRMNHEGELSFSNVVTFNMDEYMGLSHDDPHSYWYFMHENLFDRLKDMKPENINIPDGMAEDPEKECEDYERKIACYGGIDLFLGGMGVNGHLAFNEPFTSLRSRTGIRKLTTETRMANSRFFDNDISKVPLSGLSVGIATVTDSREVLLLVHGHNKARALAESVEGAVTSRWPCSVLQMHNGAIIACDETACGELTPDTYRNFLDAERAERL